MTYHDQRTIHLSPEVWETLKKMKADGETWGQYLIALLNHWKKTKCQQKNTFDLEEN